MNSKFESVKNFVKELKSKTTCGMDQYPFWYIYKDEFHDLEDILDDYQRIYTIVTTGMVERK